jgi:hypothetical protein
MIDYARPTMMAETALKDLHNAMLDKRYQRAMEEAKAALQHVADIIIAIEHARKNELS